MEGCQICSKVNAWTCWRPLVMMVLWMCILSNCLARVLNSGERHVKGSLVRTFLDTSSVSEEHLIMSNSSISAQAVGSWEIVAR